MPQAHWIWRGDVTPGGAADLQVAVFQQTFVLGASPSGTIQVGADDFAEVIVNGVVIGATGSVSSVSAATASETGDDVRRHPGAAVGSNTITVVGQNGPSSFAGGCGGRGCTYSQNPAGVIFAGMLAWS